VFEFSTEELVLLNHFIRVIGVFDTYIEAAVVRVLFNSARSWLDGSWSQPVDEFYTDSVRQGYLVLNDISYSEIFQPRYMLSHCVKALVTDKGRLVYLDMSRNQPIVLSELCSSLGCRCIHTRNNLYILDDGIKFIEPNFVAGYIHVAMDITDYHNQAGLEVLYALRSNGRIDLIKESEYV